MNIKKIASILAAIVVIGLSGYVLILNQNDNKKKENIQSSQMESGEQQNINCESDQKPSTEPEKETKEDELRNKILDGSVVELGLSAELDLDGDGTKENIKLTDLITDTVNRDPFEDCDLTVNQTTLLINGMNVEGTVIAISLDHSNILLAIYENGPSSDPCTRFYQYKENELVLLGAIDDDIRNCQLMTESGKPTVIRASFRCDIVQTQFAYGQWTIDDQGMLSKVAVDTYECVNPEQNYYLNMDVTVYEERDLTSTQSVIKGKQNVRMLRTDGIEWLYLEGEDGSVGWMKADWDSIEGMNQTPEEVFSGLIYAD